MCPDAPTGRRKTCQRTPSRPGKKTSISNRSGGDKRSPRSTRSSTVSQVSKIYGSIIRAPEWANPHLTQQRLRQSLDDISYRVIRWRTRFRGLISRVRLRTERPRRWSSRTRTPSRPGKKTSISKGSGGDKQSPRSTQFSTVSLVP